MSPFSLQFAASSTRSSSRPRFSKPGCRSAGLEGAAGRTWLSLMVSAVGTRVGLNNIINSEPTIATMVGRVAEAKSTSHNGHSSKRHIKCLCLEVKFEPKTSLHPFKRWIRPIFRPSDKARSSLEGVEVEPLVER